MLILKNVTIERNDEHRSERAYLGLESFHRYDILWTLPCAVLFLEPPTSPIWESIYSRHPLTRFRQINRIPIETPVQNLAAKLRANIWPNNLFSNTFPFERQNVSTFLRGDVLFYVKFDQRSIRIYMESVASSDKFVEQLPRVRLSVRNTQIGVLYRRAIRV